MPEQQRQVAIGSGETASCFVHGEFDAALRRCPECGAGRGSDTTGAAARNSRPTSREALELALRSIVDDDDAVSVAQIVLGEGWRPPAEVERLQRALGEIEGKARWYADNLQRDPHEVDHALCVEILDLAQRALDG